MYDDQPVVFLSGSFKKLNTKHIFFNDENEKKYKKSLKFLNTFSTFLKSIIHK